MGASPSPGYGASPLAGGNFIATMRCTTKNLYPTTPPAGGGATADTVNATFTLVQDPANPASTTSGSVTLTYPLSEDQFQIGSYYSMTLAPGTPPAGRRG
jgi:hypothetical protein